MLNKALEVTQPILVLFPFLGNHVIMKESRCARINTPNFKIGVESLLEVFVQITEDKKKINTKSYHHRDELNPQTDISKENELTKN